VRAGFPDASTVVVPKKMTTAFSRFPRTRAFRFAEREHMGDAERSAAAVEACRRLVGRLRMYGAG
jgi:hypothetical protein